MRACEREETVLAAGDEPGDELAAHVAGCPGCREALRVAGGLRRLAAEERPPRLPTAAQVWWRAQIVSRLAGREAEIERATRPLAWGLGIGALAAFLGIAAALGQLGALLSAMPVEPSAGWWTLGLAALGTPVAAFVVLFVWIWHEV